MDRKHVQVFLFCLNDAVQLKINSRSPVFTLGPIADNGPYRTTAFIICDSSQ
jgi:hypothetical protein